MHAIQVLKDCCRFGQKVVLVALLWLWAPSAALAGADGPDFWNVTGVAANDVLNMHSESGVHSPVIARVPHDARGLRNLGCSGVPSFEQWQKMSEAQRAQSAHARWCKVEYKGHTGWVAGRFLAEGEPPTKGAHAAGAGPWSVQCEGTACAIVQTGVAAQRPTLLRIEPREGTNARITIERAGLPADGMLEIYMDGEQISAGPIAPLRAASGDRLVMEPDDITLGLLRQMERHKNMVVLFAGEDRGVEFRLEQLAAARKEIAARGGGK